jgi:demethylmenaquinone methyltransferase/2-methoxy-6-polyprenyl-1,4-benzoquinol methylase
MEADAERLPLADASVDSYTIAFGLRNVTRPEAALADAARVLRRGGRLLVLEFSHVELEPLRAAYDAYSFAAIPAMGKLVVRMRCAAACASALCALRALPLLRLWMSAQTGDAAPYQYLVESIRQFATQEELADMMRARAAARDALRGRMRLTRDAPPRRRRACRA